MILLQLDIRTEGAQLRQFFIHKMTKGFRCNGGKRIWRFEVESTLREESVKCLNTCPLLTLVIAGRIENGIALKHIVLHIPPPFTVIRILLEE